jgi:hypothetical protein
MRRNEGQGKKGRKGEMEGERRGMGRKKGLTRGKRLYQL